MYRFRVAAKAPGSTGPPVWFSYCNVAASLRLKVIGKVKDWPDETVEGREALPHCQIGLPVEQLVTVIAVFALQVT